MKADKLRAKDLITTAIFTVIFFAIVMVGTMTFGIVPVLYPFLVSFIALVGGTVWAYMRVKVPKTFSILIQAVITFLLIYLMGSGWTLALGFLVGGILAEIITSIRKYKSFKLNTAGFATYCLGIHFGAYLIPLIAREAYIDLCVSSGMDMTYLEIYLDFMSWPVMLGAAVLCVAFSVIGMLIGKALLKKHFMRAGMV